MLSGRRLDLIDPSPLDVEIADIAHGLARVARWNGQTQGPEIFSVAQHSLLVEALVAAATPRAAARTRGSPRCCTTRPEYVIGDMISPFKAAIGGDYKLIEKRLLSARSSSASACRRAADRTGEARSRPPTGSRPISRRRRSQASRSPKRASSSARPHRRCRRFAGYLEPMRPAEVEARFLGRFAELDVAGAGA